MDSVTLFAQLLKGFPSEVQHGIHPLHKAMLEECCENAIANPQGVDDQQVLVIAAGTAFLTCNEMMIDIIRAGLEQADSVNIHYRSNSYTFDRNSTFVKSLSPQQIQTNE